MNNALCQRFVSVSTSYITKILIGFIPNLGIIYFLSSHITYSRISCRNNSLKSNRVCVAYRAESLILIEIISTQYMMTELSIVHVS